MFVSVLADCCNLLQGSLVGRADAWSGRKFSRASRHFKHAGDATDRAPRFLSWQFFAVEIEPILVWVQIPSSFTEWEFGLLMNENGTRLCIIQNPLLSNIHLDFKLFYTVSQYIQFEFNPSWVASKKLEPISFSSFWCLECQPRWIFHEWRSKCGIELLCWLELPFSFWYCPLWALLLCDYWIWVLHWELPCWSWLPRREDPTPTVSII